MKLSVTVITILAIAVLAGCTTVTTSFGRPFDSSKVPQIKKGTTTAEQAIAWFGQPVTKSVFGSDGEVWVYHDTSIDTRMADYGIARNVKQETAMRRLELFVRNALVENFTYTEGPM